MLFLLSTAYIGIEHREHASGIGAWQAKDEDELENDLAPCRAALGDLDFEQAMEKGRAMTMEQAIAYALETPQ